MPATAVPSLVVTVAVTGPVEPPVRVTLTAGVGSDSPTVKRSGLNWRVPAFPGEPGGHGAGSAGSSAGASRPGTSAGSSPLKVMAGPTAPWGSRRNAVADEPNSLGGPAMRL